MTNILPENSALFQFVQVDSDAVYIDSRVYCREVIEVDHGDWLSGILKKYHAELKSLYGDLPISEDYKPSRTKGGVFQKYVLLGEDQIRFLLAKSRKGISKEWVRNFEKRGWDMAQFQKSDVKIFAKKRESLYAKDLAIALDGQREVKTLAGAIDVLTATEVIEVKKIGSWKHAIGQVLVYGDYYPSHQKRIHLYGETQESFLSMIEKHCEKRGILVTWEA